MTLIRRATEEDAAAIADIYAPYVESTAITFETEPIGADEIAERMQTAGGLYPWLVVEEEGRIAGYAYAGQFNVRQAYRFSVYTTVYLRNEERGRGLGNRIYRRLLDDLADQGFTQAIALITLPNEASVALHEKLGFAHTGFLSRIGYKLGGWHDVGIWQAQLTDAAASPREPRPPADRTR